MNPCPSAPPEGRGEFLNFRIDHQKKYVHSTDRTEFVIAEVPMGHPEFKSAPTFSDFPLVLGPRPKPIFQGADTLRKNYPIFSAQILQTDAGCGLLPKSIFWGKSYFEILRYSPPKFFGAPRALFEANFRGFAGILGL